MLRHLLLLAVLILFLPVCRAQQPAEVRVSRLAEIASYPLRSAPASVLSLNETTISAEIAARVVAIPVQVGDIVNQGSPLVSLDCTNYELGLMQARAALEALKLRAELAGKRLQRTRSLRQNDSVSEESLDERITELGVMQAETESAEAVLQRARADRQRCMPLSPFTALVVERISAVGQYAGPGAALLRLVDMEAIELSAQVSTELISQVRETSELFYVYADSKYPVSIRSILPVINRETRNQEIRFLFTDKKALVGSAGKLYWVDTRPHIPADLLVERNGQLGIFLEEDGMASLYIIENAQPGRSPALNLPGKTRIIIDGHYSLKDKSPVRVVE